MTVPSDTRAASGSPVPQIVHVAIYEHRHGADVRVFADEDQAMCWRTGLAKEWWSDAFDDDPPPDDRIGEEYFSMRPRHIETGDHVPADPAGLGPDPDAESPA